MIRQLSVIIGILVFISFPGLGTASARDASPDDLRAQIERYEQAVSTMQAKQQATESDDDKTRLSAILYGLNAHLASLREVAGDLGGHTSSPPETIATKAAAAELESPSNEFENEQLTLSGEFAKIEEAYYNLDRMIRSYNSTIGESTELSEAGMRLESEMDELYRPMVEFRSWLDENRNAAQKSTSDNLSEPLMASRGLSYFPGNKKVKDIEEPSTHTIIEEAVPTAVFEDAGIEFFGFMDGVWEQSTTTSEQGGAFLNQVELDVAHEINSRTAIELAIAYGDAFEVGAATIQVTLWDQGADDGHIRHLSGSAVAVGQFDVPFGLDFQEYASVDRKLVTEPVAVEAVHDAWNDVGAVSAVSFGPVSIDAWLVQGLKSRMWDSEEEIPEDVSDDDEHWVDASPEISGGFRMNFEFAESLSSGFSLARGWRAHRPTISLAGFHTQAAIEPIEVKGELLYGRRFEAIHPEEDWGLYLQALGTFGRYFMVGRFDYHDSGGEDLEEFVSTGAGVEIGTGLEYRTEYQYDVNGNNDRVYLQMVAGF